MHTDNESTCSESKDGTGSGDRNRDYVWGQPEMLLSLVQQGNLLIQRGRCMDARHGEDSSRWLDMMAEPIPPALPAPEPPPVVAAVVLDVSDQGC